MTAMQLSRASNRLRRERHDQTCIMNEIMAVGAGLVGIGDGLLSRARRHDMANLDSTVPGGGHWPCAPDILSVIGRLLGRLILWFEDRCPELTLGPTTGELLADIVGDRNHDLVEQLAPAPRGPDSSGADSLVAVMDVGS